MKYFCIIKEKIAYVECVIQSSIFYSFYLFLSILFCNVDSALVSDSTVVFYQNTPTRTFLRVCLMITLAPRQKILSQIAFACTMAWFWKHQIEAKLLVILLNQEIACSWWWTTHWNKKSTTSKSSSPPSKRIALCVSGVFVLSVT